MRIGIYKSKYIFFVLVNGRVVLRSGIVKDWERLKYKRSPLADKFAKKLAEKFFGKKIDIPYSITGLTEFEKSVLSETAKIPLGETRTYKQIAEKIGNKNAYRAVGNALKKNPLPIIIPCHRVIRKDGKINYSLGRKMWKEIMQNEKIKKA